MMGRIKEAAVDTLETLDTVADDNHRAYWMRDNALSHALTLHKINGGMKPVNQVLADAVVILEFLKGETNE